MIGAMTRGFEPMSRKVWFDWPFTSSRSTESAVECGRIVVEGLERGLRRYGW
jgi:hypothetical protein